MSCLKSILAAVYRKPRSCSSCRQDIYDHQLSWSGPGFTSWSCSCRIS